MFKRLFVSLLILSALTAEGVVNVPWNIYSFYLCVNCGRTLFENLDDGMSSLDGHAGDFKLPGSIPEESISLPAYGNYIIKYNSASPVIWNDNNSFNAHPAALPYKPESGMVFIFFWLSVLIVSSLKKKIIIIQSDTSPPILV